MLDYENDLNALAVVEKGELLKDIVAYLQKREMIHDSMEPPEGLEECIVGALTRSRTRHTRLNQMAYGRARARDILSAQLG